ncbi:MAG: PD40 domain-containing protein [Fibrobacteria bacterium]|nr:PD40 domain-containing protein [Fibrobacteria bacterium]
MGTIDKNSGNHIQLFRKKLFPVLGIIFFLFLLLPIAAHCFLLRLDDRGAGTASLQFLKLPAGARSVALGGHTITTEEEASTVYWNPAGLAGIYNYKYAFTNSEILGEFRHEYISAIIPWREYGTFGLSANALGGNMDGRDANELQITASYLDLALGAAYGVALVRETVFAGVGLNLIRSQIHEASALGYSFTLGGMYLFKKNYRAGLTLHNLAHGIRYNTTTQPLEKLPILTTIEVGKIPGIGPWSWNTGICTNEGDHIVYGGLEYNIRKILFLRTGYETSVHPDELDLSAGLTLGAGINYRGISADFGIKLLPPLGNHIGITIGYSKKGKGALTEKEILEQAFLKFQEKKFTSARALAERVLDMNASNWKAISLLAKINKELERMSDEILSLFYTSNTSGHSVPVFENGKTMGGLSRRYSKVKELKSLYANSLFLDAGEITSKNTDNNYKPVIYKVIEKIGYDAINTSIAELQSLDSSGKTVPGFFSLPLIAGNINHNTLADRVPKFKVINTSKGLRVLVLGIVMPAQMSPEHRFQDPAQAIQQILMKTKRPGDIVVVLLNGSLNNARRLINTNADINIIILSGEQRTFEGPVINGKALILCPGATGGHIGYLSLSLNNKKEISAFSHELIPLDKNIVPDAEIDSLLGPITVKFQGIDILPIKDTYYSHIFPFINSSDSLREGRIYLKNIQTNLNYRLSEKDAKCSAPVIAHNSQKLAYTCSENGKKTLYSQNFLTFVKVKVSRPGEHILQHRWGPDQYWLYYSSIIDSTWNLFKTTSTGAHPENITKGRFGKVSSFDISQTSDKLAIQAFMHDRHQIWMGDMQLGTPVRITTENQNGIKPLWSPDGSHLAYLVNNPKNSAHYNLEIFSLADNKKQSVTSDMSIQNYSWSRDGKTLYYAGGINIKDLNKYNRETGVQHKITSSLIWGIREELNPRIYPVLKQDGVLFEAVSDSASKIIWVDIDNQKEKILVNMPGFNFLK